MGDVRRVSRDAASAEERLDRRSDMASTEYMQAWLQYIHIHLIQAGLASVHFSEALLHSCSFLECTALCSARSEAQCLEIHVPCRSTQFHRLASPLFFQLSSTMDAHCPTRVRSWLL